MIDRSIVDIGYFMLVYPDLKPGVGFISSGIVFFQKHLSDLYYHFEDDRIPTHLMYVKEIKEDGTIIVHSLEAEGAVDIPLTDFNYDMIEVYRINDNISREDLQKFLNERSEHKKGKPYAFFQLIYYIAMWAVEKFVGMDPRKWKNFFPFNEVCTEDGWQYFMERSKFSPNNSTIQSLVNYMNLIWTENTIRPQGWRWLLNNSKAFTKTKDAKFN